jgi:hypothetical protein
MDFTREELKEIFREVWVEQREEEATDDPDKKKETNSSLSSLATMFIAGGSFGLAPLIGNMFSESRSQSPETPVDADGGGKPPSYFNPSFYTPQPPQPSPPSYTPPPDPYSGSGGRGVYYKEEMQ